MYLGFNELFLTLWCRLNKKYCKGSTSTRHAGVPVLLLSISFFFFFKASLAVGLFWPFEWQGVQMDQMRQEHEWAIIAVALCPDAARMFLEWSPWLTVILPEHQSVLRLITWILSAENSCPQVALLLKILRENQSAYCLLDNTAFKEKKWLCKGSAAISSNWSMPSTPKIIVFYYCTFKIMFLGAYS